MLLTVLHCAYLVSYSYQIHFPGWGRGVGVGGGVGGGWVAGLTEIKANSASQQSWSLAELGNYWTVPQMFVTRILLIFVLLRILQRGMTELVLTILLCWGNRGCLWQATRSSTSWCWTLWLTISTTKKKKKGHNFLDPSLWIMLTILNLGRNKDLMPPPPPRR